MDKILLIGKRDEDTSSINKNLSGSYSIQLCSKHPEDIKAIMETVKPDLVIICNAGNGDTGIIGWLMETHQELPVLAVTTADGWKECMDCFQGEKYDKLLYPYTNNPRINIPINMDTSLFPFFEKIKGKVLQN